MKTSILPDNILRAMSKADRAPMGKVGVTTREAHEIREARTERELQKQISNLLRLHGIWFAQSRFDRKTTNVVGTPDFLFSVVTAAGYSVPVAWEIKTATGRLGEDQERCHAAMRKNGWRVEVIRSYDDAMLSLRDLTL